MQKISDSLVNLAYDVLSLNGQEKQVDFGEGTDYQGELYLSWDGGKFCASLTVFSDPHTTGGFFYDPPETTWREEQDEFEAVKIRDVANWLKNDWGFELAPPSKATK